MRESTVKCLSIMRAGDGDNYNCSRSGLLASPAVGRRTTLSSAGVRGRGTDGGTDVVDVDVVVRTVAHFVPAVDAILVVGGQVSPLLGSGASECIHTEAMEGGIGGAGRGSRALVSFGVKSQLLLLHLVVQDSGKRETGRL